MLSKSNIRVIAESMGVPSYGTRAEILGRVLALIAPPGERAFARTLAGRTFVAVYVGGRWIGEVLP